MASEGRFREAGDASPVGFALYHPLRGPDRAIIDFECTYVNDAGARVLGHSAADMVGGRLSALEPNATLQGKFAAYVRVVQSGEPDEREFRYQHAGIDVAVDYTMVRVERELAVTFSHITAWLRATEEIAELRAHAARAERRAARVLEQVRDAHLTLDRDFRILSVNPSAERALRRGSTELCGAIYWDVFPGSTATEAGRAFQRVVAEGIEVHLTQQEDEEGLHLDIDAYPTDDGGVAIVWRDVTDRVVADEFQREFASHIASWNTQLQESLQERDRLLVAERSARAEAEAANRAKAEFLAVMSHELRTPLNAIDGYAELIELGIRGPVTEEQRHDLARIRKSERHLLGLINGVLNYAQVEAGVVRYDLEEVLIDDVLAVCESLLTPQVRSKTMTLQRTASNAGLRVRADREKTQQIVLNLLSNAVKFTDRGGTVTVACSPGEGNQCRTARISVQDTGIGIPREQLERAFEPFVQLDVGLTRTRGGTGLGLTISRDLARGMGGDLTATSEVGVGSVFTLSLPLA